MVNDSAISVEAVKSFNAELRRGGSLVGRASRRVSQLEKIRKIKDLGFHQRPSATAPGRWRYLWPSAKRLLNTWNMDMKFGIEVT